MAVILENVDKIIDSDGNELSVADAVTSVSSGGGNTFKDLEIQGGTAALSMSSGGYTVTATTVLTGINIVKFHVTLNGGTTVILENGVTSGFISAGTGSCPVTVPFNVSVGTNFVISVTAEDDLGNVSKAFTHTVNVVSNLKPTAPTTKTLATIYPNDNQTATFTGSSDADGSVVSYRVKNISDPILTVDAATVALGSAHTFRLASEADVNQYWTNNSLSGMTKNATFDVVAVDNGGLESDPTQMQIEISQAPIVGEAVYTNPGTYSWTVPAGVNRVSVVCVGGGGGYLANCYSAPGQPGFNGYTGGGGLGWKNNISVTEGETITLVVGHKGPHAIDEGSKSRANGAHSWFKSTSTCRGDGGGGAKNGGQYVGDGGGYGGGNGLAGSGDGGGGSGAGGYSGNGGSGGNMGWGHIWPAEDGSGGGGSGGWGLSGLGGGVGLYGQGANGIAPAQPSHYSTRVDGNPGSGGTGANYGGAGADGAVRIIWGRVDRIFPNNAA